MKLDNQIPEDIYQDMEQRFVNHCALHDSECNSCGLQNTNYCALVIGYNYAKETLTELDKNEPKYTVVI